MDAEVKVMNGLNIADSFTTAILFTNPLMVNYEFNPMIKSGFMNIGNLVFALKILIGYYAFKLYNNKFKSEKIYKVGVGVVILLLTSFVVLNIGSMMVGL